MILCFCYLTDFGAFVLKLVFELVRFVLVFINLWFLAGG